MAEQVNITVNDQRLLATEGELLLPFLLKHGFRVPHFCYHDALGPDGNCRMCMVEIKGQKRPQVACDTLIHEGMVVSTDNENINDVKRKILELELLSHPVDCPICDQAGECSLQDYYMDFGLNETRRPKEEKKHKEKRLDIGKNIVLDQERCVLCARCTRFTQEVTHTNELAIIGRGNDARVSTLPGQQMQTPYAMNVIDLCPVGALTSKDFRFRQRVWFMHTVKGICHGCAKGCNIYLDHNQEKYKSDTLFRFRPRINEAVNGHFICDEGRLSYKKENEKRQDDFYHHGRKITQESALAYLLRFLSDENPLIIASPSLSLEELCVLTLLAKRFGLSLHCFHNSYRDDAFGDEWLRSSDRAANFKGVELLNIPHDKESLIQAMEKSNVIINVNHAGVANTLGEMASMLLHKKQIHLISHYFHTAKHHELLLPISSYSEHEGTLINEDNRLQRFEASLCNERPSLIELVHLLIGTPSTPKEVWDEHLQNRFDCAYEDLGPSGKTL